MAYADGFDWDDRTWSCSCYLLEPTPEKANEVFKAWKDYAEYRLIREKIVLGLDLHRIALTLGVKPPIEILTAFPIDL